MTNWGEDLKCNTPRTTHFAENLIHINGPENQFSMRGWVKKLILQVNCTYVVTNLFASLTKAIHPVFADSSMKYAFSARI